MVRAVPVRVCRWKDTAGASSTCRTPRKSGGRWSQTRIRRGGGAAAFPRKRQAARPESTPRTDQLALSALANWELARKSEPLSDVDPRP